MVSPTFADVFPRWSWDEDAADAYSALPDCPTNDASTSSLENIAHALYELDHNIHSEDEWFDIVEEDFFEYTDVLWDGLGLEDMYGHWVDGVDDWRYEQYDHYQDEVDINGLDLRRFVSLSIERTRDEIKLRTPSQLASILTLDVHADAKSREELVGIAKTWKRSCPDKPSYAYASDKTPDVIDVAMLLRLGAYTLEEQRRVWSDELEPRLVAVEQEGVPLADAFPA